MSACRELPRQLRERSKRLYVFVGQPESLPGMGRMGLAIGTVEDSPAGGTWSNNTSMMQITSTSNGDIANIYPYGQGGVVAFFGSPTPVMDCPACSEDDETPEGRATAPPMPTLSCSPATLTRAQSTTCSVTASGTATYSGWKFSDGSNTVTSTNTSSSWGASLSRRAPYR